MFNNRKRVRHQWGRAESGRRVYFGGSRTKIRLRQSFQEDYTSQEGQISLSEAIKNLRKYFGPGQQKMCHKYKQRLLISCRDFAHFLPITPLAGKQDSYGTAALPSS